MPCECKLFLVVNAIEKIVANAIQLVLSILLYYPFFKIYEKGREMNQATA